MKEAKTHAWIFLSVSEVPGPLHAVVAAADDLNHAIPTLTEIRRSLGWLIQQRLVQRDDTKYGLTTEGINFKKDNIKSERSKFKTWDIVSEVFETMGPTSSTEEEITEKDMAEACEEHSRRFWKAYRSLEK